MKLKKNLDATSVCELWEERNKLFLEREIDLSEVEHVTSAGIALLVKWAKYGKEESTTLKLINASDEVKHSLKLFGVQALFDLY